MTTATKTRKTSTATRKANIEKRETELAQMNEAFTTKVQELANSEQWLEMLKVMSTFHRYSLRNLMLIWLQNPEATRCAGYNTWKSLGYQVRKGEKGLRIFGTGTGIRKDDEGNPKTDENGNELKYRYYFPVSVFDRSQVDATEDAKDLDGDDMVTTLEGEDELGIMATLKTAMSAKGWTITEESLEPDLGGYTRHDSKKIVLNSKNSEAQRAKTMIHETAHALLHKDVAGMKYQMHRGIYETEAESVAHVVAQACGLDTSNYSVGYVAGWSAGNAELIEQTAKNVLKCSHEILDMLKADDET